MKQKISTCTATYAPSLKNEFMGAPAPIVSSYYSNFNAGNVEYFQDYRNENLSRYKIPPHRYGVVSTPYSPRPDLVAANRNRLDHLRERKPCDITLINAGRRRDLDRFYQSCQMQRDQYRDHTGRLHPLNDFAKSEFPYQCPPDMTSAYLSYPPRYVIRNSGNNQPIVYPRTFERSNPIPLLPRRTLGGTYLKYSDNLYNR